MRKNIWLILDGKTGHEKQIEDLVYWLRKKISTNLKRIEASSIIKIIINYFLNLIISNKKIIKPDLIICAGHRTHFEALLRKKIYGGKIIVIMKPSLPMSFFDLNIIPSHDKYHKNKNIYVTQGPLNKLYNLQKQKKNMGLILIGGYSKNFHWSNESINLKIKKIINDNKLINFTLATSRRTPTDFFDFMGSDVKQNVKICKFDQVSKNWLEKKIGNFEYSWVTQDSISMIFELLMSGSKVTIIELMKKNNKFNKLFEDLYQKKRINFSSKELRKIHLMAYQKSNAEKSAEFIVNKFFKK